MIEEKIARLPPELRQEVEDFIDYLLKRYGDYLEQQQEVSSPPDPDLFTLQEDNSNPPRDSPLSDEFPDLRVLEAAGGLNKNELNPETKRTSDILEWID